LRAERVEAWIREAERGGACVLAGDARARSCGRPVLESLPDGARLDCDEVYGPVVSLYRVGSMGDAIACAGPPWRGVN